MTITSKHMANDTGTERNLVNVRFTQHFKGTNKQATEETAVKLNMPKSLLTAKCCDRDRTMWMTVTFRRTARSQRDLCIMHLSQVSKDSNTNYTSIHLTRLVKSALNVYPFYSNGVSLPKSSLCPFLVHTNHQSRQRLSPVYNENNVSSAC